MSKLLHVLQVEDSESDAALILRHLEKAGSEVRWERVETAEEMQVALAKQAWDVVVSDYHLPQFDAPAALAILQQTGLDIPFIVASGAIGEEIAVGMMKSGAQDYFLKDNLVRLAQAVEREIKEAQSRQERKQVEEELIKSRENLAHERNLLRTLIDNLPDVIYVKDTESRYILKNLADARLMGVDSPESLEGKTDFDYYPAELAARYHEDDQTVIRSGKPLINREEPIIDANGNQRWLLTTKVPLCDGQGHVVGVVGIGRDVTERKQAEQARALLATAIEQAAEMVVITNTQGIMQYVNPAFERVTGYTPEEAIGKNPRILKSGKHNAAFYQGMWTTLFRGEVWAGHFINRKKDGSLYEEDAVISPVRGGAGGLSHFVAVKRDVSREVSLEEQLRQSQKMEAIGRLAGGIAHDFNNLLTPIIGFSEIIASELNPDNPILKDIEEIKNAGERAAILTNQLLAFSRKQVLQPKVLDLNEVVADLVKLLRRLLGEDIELLTLFGQKLELVKADPGQMDQIIMNLVVNARDAMPKGGKLTIETANVELDETYARTHFPVVPGRYVMLAVSDTGCGMDVETQAHIFEPFFTTKERGKGTGLGLSTVYGIVKQSGGFIWVYSEPEQGSVFKVYLPHILGGLEDPVPIVKHSVTQICGTETILLVEDEASVRNLARNVLERNGYTVLESQNGNDALRVALEHKGPIHLVVTDVVMPQLSGSQLAERLASIRPGSKILYMSGYTDDAIVQHGILESGIAFLQKPFTVDTLLHKVREVLETPPAR